MTKRQNETTHKPVLKKRVAKRRVTAPVVLEKVSAREFFARNLAEGAQGMLIAECSKATGIARSQLTNHVRYGVTVGRKTAKRLSDWNTEISYEKTLANS